MHFSQSSASNSYDNMTVIRIIRLCLAAFTSPAPIATPCDSSLWGPDRLCRHNDTLVVCVCVRERPITHDTSSTKGVSTLTKSHAWTEKGQEVNSGWLLSCRSAVFVLLEFRLSLTLGKTLFWALAGLTMCQIYHGTVRNFILCFQNS